jgi:hypothetical protein
MPKVYIVNRSPHDFSAAKPYGELVYLSEGSMNRYSTNHMIRLFTEGLTDSSKDDFIVPCSLNVMNAIASAVFAHKHGTINLLLFKEGRYIERRHIL